MENILLILIISAAGAAAGYFFTSQQAKTKLEAAKQEAHNLKSKAEIEAEKKSVEITSQAKEKAAKLRIELERREYDLKRNEEKVTRDMESLKQAKKDVKGLRTKIASELEKVAGMPKEEAAKRLKEEIEEELDSWIGQEIRKREKQIQKESEEKSREILVNVMQKSATDFVVETTTTTFDIPDEGLKGKIIGKEGRNIRTFERLTGVDIVVDEAPNQVTISCFDPIRREVAALALKKLLEDGRVHPAAIESAIKNIKGDMVKEIRKTGEQLAYDAGFADLPDEIVMLLGRFKYRFSYGQNMVKHSLEMVNIGAQLANELGADVKMTKLACLLHDIGKVMTHEYEGKPHHHISGDIVRKYLRDEKLANAVEAHHFDIEAKSLEAEIVRIADAISGSRPGARKDSYDEYIKRVTALENIAKQYDSVAEAFAVQAGREVRVVVKPDQANDKDTKALAHKIAREIEDTQSYPGTVKVTVIRETRVVEEAR